MNIRQIIFTCGVLCCAILLSPVVRGQALVDQIPDDAVVYAGWSGTDSLGAEYASSHLKAILDASDISKLLSDFFPKLLDKVGHDDPHAREITHDLQAVMGPMWKHPTAIYFESIEYPPKGQPVPNIEILCDAGADAPALLKQIQTLLDQRKRQPVPMVTTVQGGIVRLTIGHPATTGNKLGALPAFKSAMAKMHEKPVAVVFVNGNSLLKVVDMAVSRARNPDVQQHWTDIRQSLSLEGFKSAIWSVAFEDKNWGTRAFIAAPAPRAGLMKMIEGKPLPDDAFKVIPETAVMAGVGRFDLQAAFDGIKSLVTAIAPDHAADFDSGVDMVSGMAGVDIRNDLLAPIGDVWSYYIDPSTGGNGLLGGVVVNTLRDPVKAEQSFTKLEDSINGLIANQLHNEKVTIAFKQSKMSGLTVHYLAVPFITPAWAIKDGKWIIGLYPQVVVAAADGMTAGGKSILDNPAFIDVKKRLGDVPATGMQFADLPKLAPGAYSSWLLISRYVGIGDMVGIDSPLMLLPPMHKLREHLSPAGTVSWSTDEGVFARGISPFPGSEAITADPLSTMSVAQPAILISILLPSLNKARETANRVKCQANMKQIGNGFLLYANEHQGDAPPDLGTMAIQEGLMPQVFICPSGDNAPPVDPDKMKPEDQAKWINENSDYVYIKPKGKLTQLPLDVILVHEKPDSHGGQGMNVLYPDGHADFYQMRDALKMIDDQTKQAQ